MSRTRAPEASAPARATLSVATLTAVVVGGMVGAGVYVYARAGFGDFAGFSSAVGYWASAVVGNAFSMVFVTATLGSFVPGLGEGDTPLAVTLASAGVWLCHMLVARGVREAAVVNRVVTVLKLGPILAFVVVVVLAAVVGVLGLATGRIVL